MNKHLHIKFSHGLGDCVHFAKSIPLYLARGHQVTVDCRVDKEILFRSVGANIAGGGTEHWWPHPAKIENDSTADHWNGNKAAFNLSLHPMEDIGAIADLWQSYVETKVDLANVVPVATMDAVDERIANWPTPIICVHTKGDTASESKDLADEQTIGLYRALLDMTEGTLVLLDWNNRVPRLNSYRVRHLADEGQLLDLTMLWCLMRRASLLIGVDSGPLHFAHFTNTPAIGLWTHHHPARFAIPRLNTAHVVSHEWEQITKFRRHAYNIIECPSDKKLDGRFVAAVAAKMLSAPRYLPRDRIGVDVALQHFVAKTEGRNGRLSDYVDRHKSFDLALKHIARRLSPCIVETGCIRAEDDWTGAGFSTYIFAVAANHLSGQLHSIDSDANNVEFANKWTVGCRGVSIHRQQSHDWLRSFNGKIDLFYSDSADVGTPDYDGCCLAEIQLAIPKMRDDSSRILIDDTVWNAGCWHGKGRLAVPWLLENGWSIEYAGYQTLLVRTRCH